MLRKTGSSQSPTRRGLSALPWVAVFGLCSLPVFLGILNHDVAWLLCAAESVMDGRRLYVDVMEINPPLIVWLNLVPVLFARILGISEILAFRILMLGVLAGTLLMSRWALDRADPDQPATRRPILILVMIALLLLVGYDFGQREHLMLTLFLPYLLLASARLDDRPMGVGMPWAIGLAAGVGVSLKPHFVLLWLAIEAYLAWRRQGWRVWLRPEAIAVATVGLSYGVAIAVLTPEYPRWLFWITSTYAACGHASFLTLMNQSASWLTMVAALGFVAIRPRGPYRECCQLFLIASLALLGIAFIQGKGYSYHFYPALATALLLIGLLALQAREDMGRFRAYSSLIIKGILAITVLNAAAARLDDWLFWKGNPGESDTSLGRMVRVVRDQARSGSIYTFSPAVAASFPLVNYSQVRWLAGHSCLLHLPNLYPKGLRADQARAMKTTEKLGPTERVLFDIVVKDLLRDRPTLLLVQDMSNLPAFNGRPFDYLAYYSLDPRFAAFLEDYERMADVDQFRIYRRKPPAVVQKTNGPDSMPIQRNASLSSLAGRPRR